MTLSSRILFTLILVVAGCISEPTDSSLSGLYTISLLKKDGQIENKGWIQLDASKEPTLTGAWSLEISPGNGALAGTRDGADVSFDLYPGWRDNNLILTGKFDGATIKGNWQWIGFAGVMNEGSFKATKQK